HSTVASAPFASRRERLAATSTSWNRLSMFWRQSSTVTRAIKKPVGSLRKGAGVYVKRDEECQPPGANAGRSPDTRRVFRGRREPVPGGSGLGILPRAAPKDPPRIRTPLESSASQKIGDDRRQSRAVRAESVAP